MLIDTTTLIKIFKHPNYTSLCLGEGSMSNDSIKHDLWAHYFKIMRKEFKSFNGKNSTPNYKFGFSITTDGVSVGIIHTRADIESRKVLLSDDGV